MEIRTTSTTLTQTFREAGVEVSTPTSIVTATVVVANPLAGKGLVQDLSSLEQLGNEVAGLLTDLAIASLTTAGISATAVRGYGKGAIVGIDGEREHTAAVLHPRFGAPVRAAIGGGADIIPGTKKVGGPGASITIPIGNKDDRWVFDDMDSIDVCLPDAPRPNEILVTLALSVGGRPHARVQKPTS